MFNNALYIIIIAILCYTLYSYIQSYHKIIDELTKIRIKCINNKQYDEVEKNKNIHNEQFKIELKNNQQDNYENNDYEDNENNNKIDEENQNNNVFINFQKLSNVDNDNYRKKKINVKNDISNPLSNNSTDKEFINNVDINKIQYSNKNKIIKTLDNNIDIDIETNQNFEKEKEIEYWSPYKEKHEDITEGFVSSPYKGFNQNLYENLIIDSNTITNKISHFI